MFQIFFTFFKFFLICSGILNFLSTRKKQKTLYAYAFSPVVVPCSTNNFSFRTKARVLLLGAVAGALAWRRHPLRANKRGSGGPPKRLAEMEAKLKSMEAQVTPRRFNRQIENAHPVPTEGNQHEGGTGNCSGTRYVYAQPQVSYLLSRRHRHLANGVPLVFLSIPRTSALGKRNVLAMTTSILKRVRSGITCLEMIPTPST